MEWIYIHDRLPVQRNREEESEHEWVPVTDGKNRWAIAKCYYDPKVSNFVWRFWEGNKTTFCPSNKFEVSQMRVEDIQYWADIWSVILKKKEEEDLYDREKNTL